MNTNDDNETNIEKQTATFLWADLETTGLDPNEDSILEAAVVVTDRNLVCLYSGELVVGMTFTGQARLNANDYVREMHTKSGLLTELENEAELLVYPALLPTQLPFGSGKEEGDQAGVTKGRGTETRELRDYRSEDEVRSIHWKRSASLGRPVVREFEREASLVLSLLVDNAPHAPASELEEDLSRAAYLVERALARGYSVEVCARGGRSPFAAFSPRDKLHISAAQNPALKAMAFTERKRRLALSASHWG